MNKYKLFIFTLAFVFFFSISIRQMSAQWIGTNGPPSSAISLDVYGNNLFAGTSYNGVYKTTDNGTSWTFSGLPNHFVLDFAHSGSNLFAGSWNELTNRNGGGVFLSIDSGESWTEVNNGLLNKYVLALIIKDNILFAGTDYNGGLFKSTDNGTSWSPSGLTNRKVTSFTIMDNILFAHTYVFGLFRSTDNGTTWIYSGLPNQYVRKFAIIGNDMFAGTWDGDVFKSTDIGASWTMVNSGQTSSQIHGLVASGNNLFAGTWGSGVFLSPDVGTSWVNWSQGMEQSSVVMSLVIAGDYIYSGNWEKVYRRNLSDVNIPCGPAPHFIDNCSAATDSLNFAHYCETQSMIRISNDTSDNCNVSSNLLPLLRGQTIVRRNNPMDTSGRFPGVAQPDGHNDIIEAELESMDLRSFVVSSNGDTAFFRIIGGAGNAIGPCGNSLLPTYGYIHELPENINSGESIYDLYFELTIKDPHGVIGLPNPEYYLYNQTPVRIGAVIDRIPPRCGSNPVTNEIYTVYKPDENTCLKLYATCIPDASDPPIAKIIQSDFALPVELTSFTSSLTGNELTINWTTSSEINNEGFTIERMSESDWIKIGFVAGKGKLNTTSQYTYTDRNLPSGLYHYRLKQIDFNGNFEYFELSEAVTIGVPDKFFLSQNYPNPFNPVTKIAYDIPVSGKVRLKIYDNTGRELITLAEEFKEAGYYRVEFNGSRYASGVYYYKLESGNFISTKKMVLVK